jgi:two-component system, LytTR family, response regulator
MAATLASEIAYIRERMIGQAISHYRIVAEIGKGGMGVVYRALDTSLGREVAIKVLAPGPKDDPEAQRRLRREARAAAGLAHPGICVVHEIDVADGATFVVMELVKGTPLQALLARGPLTPARALDIALEVAEAMAEAHAHGIVHRDLKPSNVMVTESGRAKVIDFGLAKVLQEGNPLESGEDTSPWGDTDPGRIVGTAAYMSPEQVRGRRVDPRSDVFSFGAMLYELVVGRPAFRRDTAVETLHAVLKEPAPRLPMLPGLGASYSPLQKILDGCLDKEPAARYPSLAALRDELQGVRAGLDAANEASLPARSQADHSSPRAVAIASSTVSLRVLIVDDEAPARALLREYLGRAEDVVVVGECANGFEAVKATAELGPDLLFLDIQMPKLDGFEVLELLGREVGVVFVTAFDEHALRAFEVNAVDYLLKPVAEDRFHAALLRARQRLQAKTPLPVADLLTASRPKGLPLERILVRNGARVDVIPVADLDYAEAQDDYVSLRAKGKEHLKQQTLQELEEGLDQARFVRIHRRYLLNLDRLARLETEGADSRAAVLKDGTRLPVSRTGHQRLKALL